LKKAQPLFHQKVKKKERGCGRVNPVFRLDLNVALFVGAAKSSYDIMDDEWRIGERRTRGVTRQEEGECNRRTLERNDVPAGREE
jgi:hypothetical protein